MNESTFPGTEQHDVEQYGAGAQHGTEQPAPPAAPAAEPSAPPQRSLTPPENYAAMPRPTAKLTAEDLAPVSDPSGPRKIGPTGRPTPDLPEPLPPTKTGPAQVIAMCN